MKLQAAVNLTSLQNAKFTSIIGYTSCRPTYIESFMTIFGQCINVLNYKKKYSASIDINTQLFNRPSLLVLLLITVLLSYNATDVDKLT